MKNVLEPAKKVLALIVNLSLTINQTTDFIV